MQKLKLSIKMLIEKISSGKQFKFLMLDDILRILRVHAIMVYKL